MSDHVLLNLLNELRKSYKMRGLPSILLLFRNKFDKFNNTGARMLDPFHHFGLIEVISGLTDKGQIKLISVSQWIKGAQSGNLPV